MEVLVRELDGNDIGYYVNYAHIPRAGEELVLYCAHRLYRTSYVVRNVLTVTQRYSYARASKADVTQIVLEVERSSSNASDSSS